MPEGIFGQSGTWLRGHLEGGNQEDYTYVNIDLCPRIHLENEDDFLIYLPYGEYVRLLDCVWLKDLSEIQLAEG